MMLLDHIYELKDLNGGYRLICFSAQSIGSMRKRRDAQGKLERGRKESNTDEKERTRQIDHYSLNTAEIPNDLNLM